MKFDYSIAPGTEAIKTPSSLLVLSKRHAPNAPFTVDTGVRYTEERVAILSLLFNPVKLATRKQWHMITTTQPEEVIQKLESRVTKSFYPDEARLLMSQLALYLASGACNGMPSNASVDTLVTLLPDYERAVPTREQVHKAGFGMAQALLQRLQTENAA